MTDRIDFETRLEERLRARATIAVRPFDAGAIANRAAAAGGRPGLGRPRLPSVARLVILAIVLLAIVSSVVLVGAQLLRAPRVDHDLRQDPRFSPDATEPTREPSPRVKQVPRFSPVSGLPDGERWLGVLADGRVLIAPDPGPSADPGGGPASLWDPATGTLTPTGKPIVPDRDVFRYGVPLDDGRLLLAGGDYDQESPVYPTAEVYDPKTGTFTSLGRMLDPGIGAAVRLADGRVLVTPGITGPGNPPDQPLADSEIFDPRTNTFARTGGLIAPRANPDVVALADGRVLVVGGQLAGPSGFFPNDDSPETGSAEIYDPQTGRFTATGSLPAFPDDAKGYRYHLGWWGPLVTLPDGRALVVGLRCQEVHDVVGGVSAGVSKTPSYFYDPRSGTFLPGPVLPHCVERAFTLADGRVFVVGWWYEGADTVPESDGTIVLSGNQVRWSAVLDPTTGTLTDAGLPPDNVEYVYAHWLPLPDGRILVRSAYDHKTFVLENSP